MTAWFLAQMKNQYGDNIFFNREAWRFDRLFSWVWYLLAFLTVIAIIFNHPDFGTSILYLAVFSAMIFIAGLPWSVIPVIGIGALMMGVVAFFTLGHVQRRIISFITGTGDTYQVDNSVDSIRHGGLLGSGDDAFVKQYLPDAHTDFIFASVVEDGGAIAGCFLLVLLFLIIRRLILTATTVRDKFVLYAISGTTALFAIQSCFNLATTLRMMPTKGMTLPFISSGGSSFLGYCLLFGFILALVREDKWKQ
jgi:cell division protein FtsW